MTLLTRDGMSHRILEAQLSHWQSAQAGYTYLLFDFYEPICDQFVREFAAVGNEMHTLAEWQTILMQGAAAARLLVAAMDGVERDA
jgi:hypothetical protein